MRIFRDIFSHSVRPATAPISQTSGTRQSRFWPLRRRSSVELAGAFVFISILAVVSTGLSNSQTPSAGHNAQPQASSLDLQVTHAAANSAASTTSPTASNDSTDSATAPATVSTNVSSTTNNGSNSTSVTVNGQPLNVPANGTVQQTITGPGGSQTTVNVSNNQSDSGSSDGSNTSSSMSSFSISSSTASSNLNYEEDSQAP